MPAGHCSVCVHEMPSETDSSKELGIKIPTVWIVVGFIREQASRYPA